MDFDELSPELQEKVKATKTPEEIIALAEAEGYELSSEELDAISAGLSWNSCPWHNFKPCRQKVTTPSIDGRE